MRSNPDGRRALLPSVRAFTVEPLSPAQPGPGQILVETDVSLVSPGTELAVYAGIHPGLQDPDASWPRLPFAPGCSAAGRVDATGAAEALLQAAELVAYGGQVVVLGSPRGVAREVDMYHLVHRRSITITGAHGSLLEGAQAGRTTWTEDRALGLILHLLAAERLDVMDLVTHEIRVEQLGQTYEAMLEHKDPYLGVLIRWD